jgi:hypothetical protein
LAVILKLVPACGAALSVEAGGVWVLPGAGELLAVGATVNGASFAPAGAPTALEVSAEDVCAADVSLDCSVLVVQPIIASASAAAKNDLIIAMSR